jgi:hypothetical protein
MRKIVSSVLLLACALTATAQSPEEKRYTLNLTDPSQPAHLEVEMRHGEIKIEGYDGDTVEILAKFSPLSEQQLKQIQSHQHERKAAKGQDKPSRSTDGLKVVNNALINLQIQESANRVDITSEFTTYHIDLLVRVPKNSSVDAQLYDGKQIDVSNVTGAIELESWKGDIYASGITGPIVAETYQSAVVVEFAQFNGETPTSLTTYSGDIDITLANSTKAQINVQNYQGQILSGLDAEFVPTESVERNGKGRKQQIVIGGQMSAKLNGGGQDLSIITYTGNVYLRKK